MVLDQLSKAGYRPYLTVTEETPQYVRGTMNLSILPSLECDDNFLCGVLHKLHKDVGKNRIEYRSLRGKFGKGSLQIVIDRETGSCYCDVDGWNVYEDVVGQVGHTVGDLFLKWFKRTVLRRR